jgi:hypothetical protein
VLYTFRSQTLCIFIELVALGGGDRLVEEFKYLDVNRVLWQIPGNGHDVSRSKVAPRLASCIPRNGSDNAKIVPGSIFAPRKDPPFPRSAGTVPGNIYRPSTCLGL